MEIFKRFKAIFAVVLDLALSAAVFAGCASNKGNINNTAEKTKSQTQNNNSSINMNNGNAIQKPIGKDTDGDGIPDTVEKAYGTNPYTPDTDGDGQNDLVDKDPTFAQNPIKETSVAKLPVNIKDARVEDNATADHLEITFTNTGKEELKSFDIYFTVTDNIAKKKEAYYQKLNSLSVKPGETKTIHFDNKNDAGHYYGNMNGLYGTSKNELIFDVLLHNNNYKPLSFQVKKSKGTAEVAD
jgi:hypothetical protein